jgi:hypothetical protein
MSSLLKTVVEEYLKENQFIQVFTPIYTSGSEEYLYIYCVHTIPEGHSVMNVYSENCVIDNIICMNNYKQVILQPNDKFDEIINIISSQYKKFVSLNVENNEKISLWLWHGKSTKEQIKTFTKSEISEGKFIEYIFPKEFVPKKKETPSNAKCVIS